MFRRCATVAAMAAALTCLPHPVLAQAAHAYRVDDLGSFGGGDLVGLAINNNGDVAGYGYLPNGAIHAFRWTQAGGLEDLGANGGWLSQAIGINDNGDVVGVYLDVYNNPHGFVAPLGGGMQDLRTPDRQIVRVNSITNDGRMTGMLYSYTPYFQVHAFRTLIDGTLEDLGDTVYASVGWHINESGQVTGFEASTVDNNTQAAFRFSDGSGKVSLGTLGGQRSSGMSINSSGVVVGWSEVPSTSIWSRAFRAIPGQAMEDLGTLSGTGAAGAEAINDNGTIVGWSTGRYWMTAFVYTDADGMVDLNSRLSKSDSSLALTDAMGVNNSGQIVVLYQTSTGGYGTVRLTPLIDTEPPVIVSASATPDLLYPPTEQMVSVSVSIFAVDNIDPAPACGIRSVTNSEAPASGPDPDVQIVDGYSLLLRASRRGSGNGRTYTITVGCGDGSGNTSTTQLLVRVPHDEGKSE
jgi:probable HAF family extracellular repeat protein